MKDDNITPDAELTNGTAPATEDSAEPREDGIAAIPYKFSLFGGVLLMLLTIFIAGVSISFLSTVAADQSVIEHNSIAQAVELGKIHNIGGPVGAWIAQHLINDWMGLGSFVFIYYLAVISLYILKVYKLRFWSLTLRCLISALTISMVLGYIQTLTAPHSVFYWGGEYGHQLNALLIEGMGWIGALFVNLTLVMLMILVFYEQLAHAYARYKRRADSARAKIAEARQRRKEQQREKAREDLEKRLLEENEEKENESSSANGDDPAITEPILVAETEADTETGSTNNTDIVEEVQPGSAEGEPLFTPPFAESSNGSAEEPSGNEIEVEVTGAEPIETVEGEPSATSAIENLPPYDPRADLSRYRFPSLDLLHDREVKEASIDITEQEKNMESIKRTLNYYKIGISKISATVGPTVTLFEIVPDDGIRIAQIKRLEDDIARSLSALGIRIIAPIPGRGTIGIEVPNHDPQIVPIRTILSSKEFRDTKMELPMAVGTTINNEVFIADLTKMPHLLVAGATGQGKSVGLNTIIASLLYKKHPAELKFVLVDPKLVEFSLYAKLERHYLAKMPDAEDAVITDTKKVVTTLNSLCVEMDNRYNLLKMAGERNIKDYNKRFTSRRLNPNNGHRYLPYIVVIVDEFADLIMTAGKEVETPIARLAQKARAVGIHLIIATQRPSTNVITGIIKANFPGRVAFRVTQGVDSKTIIDRPGAHQLIGRGDMLFSRDGDITRVQCAFIDTDEVEAICNSIDEQVGYESAYLLPEYIPDSEEGGSLDGSNNFGERDTLFDEAARAIVTANLASTSSLQRRYSIGYVRAGKIMDQMEAAGIVGPSQGGKPRKILVNLMELEDILSANSKP